MPANAKDTPTPPPAAALAVRLAREADELACDGVCILDVRGISPVTDFFVIASAGSARQLRSVADSMEDAAAAMGHRLLGMEGRQDARWILLDFVDVVAHLFDPPSRSHYDLELLWGDAPRIEWRQ
jgi:ribosome-associated protein